MRIALIAATTLPAALAAQVVTATTVTTAELRGLSVVSDRVVWASGQRGTVARTTDGGDRWHVDTIPGATHLDFRAIHAFDDKVAVVASAGEAEKGLAKIYATNDGGRTWTLAYSAETKGMFLDALAFWDAWDGVALSDPVNRRFVLPVTRDGGAAWSVDMAGGPRTIPNEAAFAASNSSMVAMGQTLWIGTGGGGRARVLRSVDRGKTWTSADVPVHAKGQAAGIFAIAFADQSNGVAVGGDYTKPRLAAQSVALTNNGGRTWRRARRPPAAYLSGVAFAGSPSTIVATGLAGTFVSSNGGNSWVRVDSVPMNTVRFKGSTGFLVGPRGRIGRWTP